MEKYITLWMIMIKKYRGVENMLELEENAKILQDLNKKLHEKGESL